MRNFSGKYKIVVTFLVLTSILTAILSVDRKAPTFVESSLGLLIALLFLYWCLLALAEGLSVENHSAENDA
ncbi:MAG: hypothetical protein ACLUUN_01955 [Muribaculaceae bacterium]